MAKMHQIRFRPGELTALPHTPYLDLRGLLLRGGKGGGEGRGFGGKGERKGWGRGEEGVEKGEGR